MKNPIEFIQWHDSYVSSGWTARDEVSLGPVLCTTVGFLVSEDDTHVAIASTIQGNDFNAAITIPKSTITTRKHILKTLNHETKTRAIRRRTKPNSLPVGKRTATSQPESGDSCPGGLS
ncbi:MAG: hypothetical protein ABI162_06940 [Luteolibacter sp.]